MKNLKKILPIMFLSCGVLAADLETRTYRINIEAQCGEGDVSCNKVRYTSLSKKTGESVTLTGSTWHTTCADGTPCRFLGYRFEHGDLAYRVHQSGLLEVVRGREEVLLSEQGEWRK